MKEFLLSKNLSAMLMLYLTNRCICRYGRTLLHTIWSKKYRNRFIPDFLLKICLPIWVGMILLLTFVRNFTIIGW